MDDIAGERSPMRARVEELSAGASDEELAVIRSILEIYLSKLPERVDAVAAAVADGDQERTVMAAHALKGASSNLGAGRVAEVSAQIEECCRSGQIALAAGLLAPLSAAVTRDASQMQGFVNSLDG